MKLLLILALLAVSARADTLADIKTRKELKVGLQAGYVPFAMRKPDGSYVGYEIEMTRAFAKYLGAEASFVDTKWEGIIPALHAKKFDVLVSGMSITPERSQAVLFSDPYYFAGLMLLVAKKHEGKIKSLADFDQPGRTLAVQLGTTGDFFSSKAVKQARITKLDLESDAASAVLLGKVDGFVFDAPYMQLFAKRHGGKVVLLPEPLTQEGLGLAARKKDTELVKEFNKFLAGWTKSGESAKVVKSFFQDMVWLKEFPQLMN